MLWNLPCARALLALVMIVAVGGPARAVPVAEASPSSTPSAPLTRRLDAASTLLVQTWKDGAAARLAHDHAILATSFSGEIETRGDVVTRIVVDVDARSLRVDDDRARALVGLEPGVPQKDKDAVTASMTGPEQLDVGRFPRIRFESTAVTPAGDRRLLVEGRFTLHGQTRMVKLPVTVEARPDGSLRGRGTLSLKVSDYGIEPYSAFLGAVKVKDEVRLHLDLIAR